MTYSDPQDPQSQVEEIPMRQVATTREATWRFLGDRAAADQAYCLRFGVNSAPEPFVAPGGAWAYPLPDSTRGR